MIDILTNHLINIDNVGQQKSDTIIRGQYFNFINTIYCLDVIICYLQATCIMSSNKRICPVTVYLERTYNIIYKYLRWICLITVKKKCVLTYARTPKYSFRYDRYLFSN